MQELAFDKTLAGKSDSLARNSAFGNSKKSSPKKVGWTGEIIVRVDYATITSN